MSKAPRNRNITPADIRAAQRLTKLWKAKQLEYRKAQKKLTQELAAEELGWTQPMVSQYLKGTTPLGIRATLRWAKLLKCRPRDIRDDIAELQIGTNDLDQEAIELAFAWQENLSIEAQDVVRRFIQSYPDQNRKSA